MSQLFHRYLTSPISALFLWIYETVAFHDFGFAVILLTVLVQAILSPLAYRDAKNQILLKKIQPRIKQIQKDHKGNMERQTQELQVLYREHNLNPFSSIISLVIQLPIFIALYQVLLQGVANTTLDNFTFLGFINLKKPQIVIAFAAAALQYFHGRIALRSVQKEKGPEKDAKPDTGEEIGRMMVFIGPLLTISILAYLPGALGLYWTVSQLFALLRQQVVERRHKKKHEDHGDAPHQN